MGYGEAASAATSVIGGELQGWASVLAKQNMADQYDAEHRRQLGYQTQALGNLQTTLGQNGSEYANQQIQKGAGERVLGYDKEQAVPLSVKGPMTDSLHRLKDAAYAKLMGGKRAALGGYADWGHQQGINNAENQRKLHQIENFAGGTAGVFPYRMYDAQHSMDTLAMIGAAISSIGGGSQDFSKYTQAPNAGGQNTGFGSPGEFYGPSADASQNFQNGMFTDIPAVA